MLSKLLPGFYQVSLKYALFSNVFGGWIELNNPEILPAAKPKAYRLWVLWVLFFFQFAGVGVYMTYLNMYYRQDGLTGTQIGLINMATSLIGVAGTVFWGNISDRTGKNRLIIAFGAAGALITAQFVPLVHTFGAFLGLGILSSLVSSSIFTLVDSTTLVMLGERREDYGRYRLGGSIGYIITASSVGFIFDQAGMQLMFPFYGAVMGAFLVMALFLPNLPVKQSASESGAIGGMVRQPVWILFTASVFLVWVASYSAITFLGVVLQSMGANEGLIGIAVTIGAVVEIPFMAFSGNLLRRFGPEKLLVIGISLSIIRFFLLGWLRDPVWAIVINLLNGPAYVLFWTSAVNITNRLAPPGLAGTAQGVFNSTISLASVVSALLTGWLFDRLGANLFEVMAFCCVASLLCFLAGAYYRRPAVVPRVGKAG